MTTIGRGRSSIQRSSRADGEGGLARRYALGMPSHPLFSPAIASPRRLLWASLALLFAGAVSQAVAFVHAWRFTHFVEAGSRTPDPEDLSPAERAWVLATGVRVPRPQDSLTPAELGLEAREIALGSAPAWSVQGDGRGCVGLFPGYAAGRSSLLHEAQAFHGLGYSVVVVGAVGDSTSLGWHEAELVRGLARHCAGQGELVLYGESMGAATVLRAVGALGVDADALILESPFDRLLTTVCHRFETMGIPAVPGAWMLVFWGGLQHGFDGFSHDPVAYAPGVEVPTLILHGDRDLRVGMDEVRSIDDALAGPHRLAVFEGAGHVSLLEHDPARWHREVEAWLE